MRETLEAIVATWTRGHLDSPMLPSQCKTWTFPMAFIEELRTLFANWDIARIAREAPFVSSRRETTDGTEVFKVPGPVGAEMYADGLPLVIREHGTIAEFSAAFARQMGLPEKDVTCHIFASKSGGKAQTHFDPVTSIAFQLVGGKRWLVQPNEWVANPPSGYLLGEIADQKIRMCTEGPLKLSPAKVSDGIERFPGEAILVPTGHWHATEALGESVSINVHVRSKTWADWLLEVVGDVVRQNAEWRKPLPREPGDETVFQMLEDFRRVTHALGPKDLCGPADITPVRRCRVDTAFWRIATSLFGVESAGDGQCVIYVKRYFDTRRLEITLPPRLLPASRWVARRDGRITPRDVLGRFSELMEEDACRLLASLEGVGLLRRE